MNPTGEPTEESEPRNRRSRPDTSSSSESEHRSAVSSSALGRQTQDSDGVTKELHSSGSASPPQRGKKTRHTSKEPNKSCSNETKARKRQSRCKSIVEEEQQEEETDEDYRRRVYGTSDTTVYGPTAARRRRGSSQVRISLDYQTFMRRQSSAIQDASRRFSRQLSKRRSSMVESLPDTPQGWVTLVTTAASALLAYELQLQKSLTSPPLVFCQNTPFNTKLRHMLSTPADKGIFSRAIAPSLLVGTRGRLASAAAYAMPHWKEDGHDMDYTPHSIHNKDDGNGLPPTAKLRFREIMRMGADGAEIAVDWEVPSEPITSTHEPYKSAARRRTEVLRGPIRRPVIVILHGINNDASFGYIRSLMKACNDKGWIAAGFNFRGCGGINLKTPRGYNGAYTGDLRQTVNSIVSRMMDEDVPLFVVGNSLGANLITKYLGEEGRAGTLPPNVAGGISLGNPLQLHSGNLSFPYAELLGMGVKKMILQQWKAFRHITSPDYWNAIKKALASRTIGQIDEALAPYMIRNNPEYPFDVQIGYENGDAYWAEASSFRYVPFVNVPLLKVTAQDDFLVYGSSLRKMSHCLENPNVVVVKTKCGGHLGWQEAPPDTGNVMGVGTSWADTATVEFIDAVIKLRKESRNNNKTAEDIEKISISKHELLSQAKEDATTIRSRL